MARRETETIYPHCRFLTEPAPSYRPSSIRKLLVVVWRNRPQRVRARWLCISAPCPSEIIGDGDGAAAGLHSPILLKSLQLVDRGKGYSMERRTRNRHSCIDPYREQVIFWHLRGKTQEGIVAALKRLYGLTVDRSTLARWLRKNSSPLQNRKTRSDG